MGKNQKNKEVVAHFARQRELLRLEYANEKAQYDQMTQAMGLERLVSRGMCWFPVRVGRSYYNSLNQLVVEVFRSPDIEDEHAFEYGRQVRFFTRNYDGSLHHTKFVATVSYVDENRMVVAVPSQSCVTDLAVDENIGVQLMLDETSYRAMFEAIEATANADDNRLAQLRDILCGVSQPQFRSLQPMRFPWLNSSQEKAVNKVLNCRDVMVVHGPPGTGKTTTLVEAICETLRREPQVLVCAQSNTAVDWISEQLVDRGAPVLRIGNPTRVNDKMLSFTYERQFESHADYPELWSIRKTIRTIQSNLRNGKNGESQTQRNRLRNLRKRAEELEIKINAELFDNARIIASTLVSSNHRLLHGRRFSSLFIDEAGQALEAACFIAIRKADRVVLAGDHLQLPPIVKCFEAAKQGLSKTLMEQAAQKLPSAVALLTTQYRMHEEIMQFSSNRFYGGELKAADTVKNRGILDYDYPIDWISTEDLGFDEQFVTVTNSRLNPKEADFFMEKFVEYVEKLGVERILEENIDFGIISPYKAQTRFLRERVRKCSQLRAIKRNITVNTIDGFQGQERDVVFISLVRSNDDGEIGFLSDLRRMNVAITRARMKLVILGDAKTLSKHKFYRELHAYITKLHENSEDLDAE